MRFKISLWNKNGHRKMVTCIAWNSAEEIYSFGEDHLLLCWRLDIGAGNPTTIAQFSNDFYPTDMQWHPRSIQTNGTSIKKQSLDVLLVTTTDGKFHLINKNGRVEKSVDAHKGSTLSGKWSFDGTAFFTAGEDGFVKIWSRSGMLRSTIVRGTLPILSATWSPDCSIILYSQGSQLSLQSLNSNTKSRKWFAHEGLILAVSWNKNNNLIISGAEDCRYKVWDSNGCQLFSSAMAEHPITSINWCPNGGYFAVCYYNTVKLCDKTGWSHSLEKVNTASIYDIAWSNDSTQVAMACGNGTILIAHVIDRKFEWDNYEATLVRRKRISVREVGNDYIETLEISDRVVHVEFLFNYLVIVTPNQCHIYSTTNWNTPAIFDLKNSIISGVVLADRHFLLIEWNMVTLYSYQGRVLGIPKWNGMTQDPLYPSCIALCYDTLVVRDQTNEKLLHILEIYNNKPAVETQPHLHMTNIIDIAINYIGGTNDRQLAIIDENRDLFLLSIRTSGFARVCKIAAMVSSVVWAIDANVLAAMLDATLSIWLCPNCVYYSDRKIIRRTRIDKDNSEFGKQPSIVSGQNGMVTVRRGDGASVSVSVYTFFTTLHQHIMNNKWQDALSLCRIAHNDTLWTCMAVLATESKQLNVVEEAYAAIKRYDKVDYIKFIQSVMNKTVKMAEMSLLAGDLLGAEGILLQNGFVNEAIQINIQMYNWNRALELAIRHKKLVNDVLESRRLYLQLLDKQETNSSYIALNVNKTISEVTIGKDPDELLDFSDDNKMEDMIDN